MKFARSTDEVDENNYVPNADFYPLLNIANSLQYNIRDSHFHQSLKSIKLALLQYYWHFYIKRYHRLCHEKRNDI